MPSKLYEYAFMGIPVIATNLPRVAELIVEGGFGFVVNTSEEVTQSVTAFKELENEEVRNRLGALGLTWVCQKINGDQARAKLKDFLVG